MIINSNDLTNQPVPYPLIVDTEKKTIGTKHFKVGLDSLPNYYGVKDIQENFVEKSDIFYKSFYKKKERNIHYKNLLGPVFPKRFTAAAYKYFILPLDKTEQSCAKGQGWSGWKKPVYLKHVWDNREVSAQCLKDNIPHMVPFAALLGQSPKDLKDTYGKSISKKLSHNSFTRNMYIAKCALMFPYILKGNIDLPSWAYKNMFCRSYLQELTAKKSTEKDSLASYHMIYDTYRMLGTAFNPEWSLKRIKEEHDKATKKKILKRYSTDLFAEEWTYEADGYKATYLNSKALVAEEGATMRHCVASYAESASSLDYLVFSIEGKERATLGCYSGLGVDQCYGYANKPVGTATKNFVREVYRKYVEDNPFVSVRPYKKETPVGLFVR